jgi:hypothetical protein
MRPGEVTGAAAIVALLIGGFAVYEHLKINNLSHDRDQLRQQLVQLSQERDQLVSGQNPRYIALRRDCAATALRMFHALGYNENVQKNDTGMPHTEEYSSHYSRQLGRCLLSYDDENYSSDKTGGHQTITKGIMDADERRQFGEYLWFSSNTKKYWEQKPVMCRETVPGKAEAWCTSSDQWDDFERDLMNS